MGRMKELYMEIYNANNGIPENITTDDAIRMKELQIFEWKKYEEAKNKTGLQSSKSENSGKNTKNE